MKLVIDLEKGIGKEMLQKYPGGQWITMHGKHVYLKADGQLAAETPIEPQNTKKTKGVDKDMVKPILAAFGDELEVGQLYKYGNQTGTVLKIGNKYVHLQLPSGDIKLIEISKLGKQKWQKPGVMTQEEIAKQVGPSVEEGEYWHIPAGGTSAQYKVLKVDAANDQLVVENINSPGQEIKSSMKSFLTVAKKMDKPPAQAIKLTIGQTWEYKGQEYNVFMLSGDEVNLTTDAGKSIWIMQEALKKNGSLVKDLSPEEKEAQEKEFKTAVAKVVSLAQQSSSYANYSQALINNGLLGETLQAALKQEGVADAKAIWWKYHPEEAKKEQAELAQFKKGAIFQMESGKIMHIEGSPDNNGWVNYHEDGDTYSNQSKVSNLLKHGKFITEDEYKAASAWQPKKGDKFFTKFQGNDTLVEVTGANYSAVSYTPTEGYYAGYGYQVSKQDFQSGFKAATPEEIKKQQDAITEKLKDAVHDAKNYDDFNDYVTGKTKSLFQQQAKKSYPDDESQAAYRKFYHDLKGEPQMSEEKKKEVLDRLDALAKKHYSFTAFQNAVWSTPGLEDEIIEATGDDSLSGFHEDHKAKPKKDSYTKAEATAMLTEVMKKHDDYDAFNDAIENDPDLSTAKDQHFHYDHGSSLHNWLKTEAMTPEEKKAKLDGIMAKLKKEPDTNYAYDALTADEKQWIGHHSGMHSVSEAWEKATKNGTEIDTSGWSKDTHRWEVIKERKLQQRKQELAPEAEKVARQFVDAGVFSDSVAGMDIPALTEHVRKMIKDHGIQYTRDGEDAEAFQAALADMVDTVANEERQNAGYTQSRRIGVRQARLEIALNSINGKVFKPLNAEQAVQRFPFHVYHGTAVDSAKSIIQQGFRLRGTSDDFGRAAYFKSPNYDPHEQDDSNKAKKIVDYFTKSNPAVLRASLRMNPNEYLDIKALGKRPEDLQATIKAWRMGENWRRAQHLALFHGKTVEELGLRTTSGDISSKKLAELEKALPADKREIMEDAVSPYEVYCRLKGYKAVNDILDEYKGEGWQLGVFDPHAIEIEDIGYGVESGNDGTDMELDKSIDTKKKSRKTTKGDYPHMVHSYGYKDGKLTMHVGVHMDDYMSEPKDDKVEKSISDEVPPGGHWVTMHGRHVYITKEGELLPATEPTRMKREAYKFPKEEQIKRLSDGGYLGGAGKKDIYEDDEGRKFIYKPAISKSGMSEPFRAHVQSAVGQIGERILDESVPITSIAIKGKTGSLQPLIPGVKGDLKKLNWHNLKPEQLRMIQQEHVLDWVVGNFDSHAGNFIVTEDGKVLGVDKEQAFRYMKDRNSHEMSTEYHPNEVYGEWEPLYNTMYREWADDEIELDPQAVLPAIQRLEAISDDEYREILKPYANSLGMGDDFLDKAVKRKHDTREQFRQFFSELTGEDFTFGDELTKAIPIVVLEQGFDLDLEKGIGKDMMDKYPGGKWVTMRGRHVYITGDGSISKETDPGVTKGKDVRSQATHLTQDHSHKDVAPGAVYRYNNSTVKVEKVGRSYVHVSDTNGKTFTVPKSKFSLGKDGNSNQQPEADKGTDTPQQSDNVASTQGNTPSDAQAQFDQSMQKHLAEYQKVKDDTTGNPKDEQVLAAEKKMGEYFDQKKQEAEHPTRSTADTLTRLWNSQEEDSPPPTEEAANNPQDDGNLDQQDNAPADEEDGTEQENSPSQGLDQHDQFLQSGKALPNTEVLTGENIGDQIEAIYKEWDKKGSTYFAPWFTQVGDGKGAAYSHGNPDYKKHTVKVVKDKSGNPAGASYTVDGGDHVYLQYAEVSPEHRATTGQKANPNKKREKGIGTQLVAEAIQESFDRGYNGRVELDADSAEDPRKFYEKLGFENTGGAHYTIEGEAAQKLLDFAKKTFGGKGKGKLQKALETDQPQQPEQQDRFPKYQDPDNTDEYARQLFELEDKLDGFIVGNVQAKVKARLKQKGLLNKRQTADQMYPDEVQPREEKDPNDVRLQ